MQKYGPYDEQARYPHDYFVYKKKTQAKHESERVDDLKRQGSKQSYAQNYDEFDDFAEGEPAHRSKYVRERAGHRYFKLQSGKVVESRERKKGPQIWAGREAINSTADMNAEFRNQGKKKVRHSDQHKRPAKKDFKNHEIDSDCRDQQLDLELQAQSQPLQKMDNSVKQPDRQVPAVLQVRKEATQAPPKAGSGARDLRPAVFIKDLKKRSIALEEEKAQHFSDKSKDKHKPESNLQAALLKLQKAIATKDQKVLSNSIYEAKMLSIDKEDFQFQASFRAKLSQAESVLVSSSVKK